MVFTALFFFINQHPILIIILSKIVFIFLSSCLLLYEYFIYSYFAYFYATGLVLIFSTLYFSFSSFFFSKQNKQAKSKGVSLANYDAFRPC
jgi:hypothetical protein